jgi:hypothetical protein
LLPKDGQDDLMVDAMQVQWDTLPHAEDDQPQASKRRLEQPVLTVLLSDGAVDPIEVLGEAPDNEAVRRRSRRRGCRIESEPAGAGAVELPQAIPSH